MPFVIGGTGRRRLAGLIASCGALALAPSAHAATASNPYNCSPQATLSQTFAAWGDDGQYTPVANAGLEDGARGWMLFGDADVVDGNEAWNVGGAADSHSLDLPARSSAVTAPMCIDETYPYFRLFAKKLGSGKGELKIDVLFLDSNGKIQATKPYSYSTSQAGWLPTATIDIGLFDANTAADAAPVAFRFTTAKDAHFQIDDVYVDPWCRR
jgi:hypothetical protein